QALRRHAARIASGERPRPDLLLIDGGPGQGDAPLRALAEAGVEGLAVVGVAKGADRRPGQERLHWPGEPTPIVLEPDSAALHFIQRVRDDRPPPAARAPLPRVHTRDRTGAGTGTAARHTDPFRRAAGRAAGRRRGFGKSRWRRRVDGAFDL